MILFLLRHAEAETRSSSGLDRDRVLTAEGRKQAERVGLYWRAEQLQFDKIVVSSAKRTQETISLCLEHSGFLTEVHTEPRMYNAETDTLMDVLLEQDARLLSKPEFCASSRRMAFEQRSLLDINEQRRKTCKTEIAQKSKFRNKSTESILMCGHNPGMGDLAARLTGDGVMFTPGTLCAIQLDPWQENEAIKGHVIFLKRPE